MPLGNVDDNGDPWNFSLIAGISFVLTMLNIVGIRVSGILMFHIEEVAPTKSKSAFWSRDIKVARAIQKGSKGVNLDMIKAGLQDAIMKEREEKKPVDKESVKKPTIKKRKPKESSGDTTSICPSIRWTMPTQ